MSELYQTPSQLAQNLRNSTHTGNWFQDQFTQWVTPGITRNEDGSISREGAAWWFQGLTPGAESIADQKQNLADARIVHQAVTTSGLTTEQIEEAANGRQLTAANVGGILKQAQITRDNKPTPLQEQQMEQNQTNSNREFRLALNNAKDAREAENKRLKLEMMKERKADQRFNEEQQRLDRKDRKTAIAGIAAGIASLGAAFAI